MQIYSRRSNIICLACALALAVVYAFYASLGGLPSAQALSGSAVYVVTTTGSAGPGSLRQAILDANANPGVDEIVFDLPGCTPANPCVITLLSLLPAISDPVTITGPGMASLAIDGNHALRVFNVDGVPAVISDLTVQNGATTGRGAGIRAFGHLMLTRVQLRHNQAEEEGGGVYAAGNLAVDESYFAHNGADNGGGLYGESGLTISDSQFVSNTAAYSGGGAVGKGTVSVIGARFENNHGLFGGGGLYLSSGELILEDTVFLGNTAVWGGGVFGYGEVQIKGGLFENNSSSYGGGGLYVDGPSGSVLRIDSSRFVANEADIGGGVLSHVDTCLVENTLFARNRANHLAAAMLLFPNLVTVKHSTIVGGTGQNVAGIFLESGVLLLENTIMARHAVGVENDSGSLHQDYNLFYLNDTDIVGSFSGGAHNVSGDPQFVAPESGDFHIGAGSAALDAGRNAGVTVDFEGDSRPLGGGFDIGFDEADLITGLAIAHSPSPTVTVQTSVLFTATVTGGSGIAYAWDFGDGSPAGSGNPISHSFTTPGSYTVTVTATNSSGSVATSVELEVVQGAITLPEYWLYLPTILK